MTYKQTGIKEVHTVKKKWLIILSVVLSLALAACGNSKSSDESGDQSNASPSPSASAAASVKLTVGASATPHAEILEFIKEDLAAEGVELEVKVFTDYVLPNVQLYEKQIDANYFQHIPYLEEFNASRNMNLVNVAGIHIEPFGIYSKKIERPADLKEGEYVTNLLDALKEGATIAIPNDVTNGGRALALLEKAGVIKLKEGVGISGTVKDIVENPKKVQIRELEAAMLPRTLDEVDLATINTNYALDAGFVPTKDALFLEDKDSPYVNVIAARPDNQDSEAIQKLVKALQTDKVKQFIEEKYNGAVVPAF